MESKRQKQLGQDIQRIMATEFTTSLKELLLGAFVTVADVQLSPDLLLAKVKITVYEKGKEDMVLENLNLHAKKVRGVLGNKIRHNVRLIPHVEFHVDHSLEKVFEIEKLLRESPRFGKEEE